MCLFAVLKNLCRCECEFFFFFFLINVSTNFVWTVFSVLQVTNIATVWNFAIISVSLYVPLKLGNRYATDFCTYYLGVICTSQTCFTFNIHFRYLCFIGTECYASVPSRYEKQPFTGFMIRYSWHCCGLWNVNLSGSRVTSWKKKKSHTTAWHYSTSRKLVRCCVILFNCHWFSKPGLHYESRCM
jgi:hypothetical protein